MRMFEQRPITDLTINTGSFLTGSRPVIGTNGPSQISPWNVLRAVVNTAHAMLARSKVRGRFLTTNGSQDQKRRAKAATQWLDGFSAETKLHALAGMALRDAEVCRFGVLALEEMDRRVTLSRVLPGEIRYDYMSARDGMPKTLFRERAMSKAVLKKKFGKGKPDVRALIESADTIQTETGANTNLVLVREGYSVQSARGVKDGWHGVVIESRAGARLLMEPWEKPWHPYIFFIWEPFLVGFGGTSLAAYLEPMQTELNHMQWVKRRARKLMARPKVGIPRGSKIVDEQLTNCLLYTSDAADERSSVD